MKIQFNTDKTINGEERNSDYFIDLIAKGLDKFSAQISRIEVHISNENGKKEGFKEIRCVLESRLIGKEPIAVTNQANTIELAVSGAIEKQNAALKTVLGKISNH